MKKVCKYRGQLVNQGIVMCFAEGDVRFPDCSEDCPKFEEYDGKPLFPITLYTYDENGEIIELKK